MLAPFILLVVAVLYRIVMGVLGMSQMDWLHNFSPVAAIALCGAVYLPRRVAVTLPLVILAASDLVLNLWAYHLPVLTFEILPRYAALLCISLLGLRLRNSATPGRLFAGCIGGSLLFYVVTNTGSWFSNPVYAKSFAGWINALTVGDGVIGHPPTWWFYRHTLVSDLLFTALFVGAMKWKGGEKQSAPVIGAEAV